MRTVVWSKNAEAILWVLAATALFSIVFASGKFAGPAASPLQIIFLRYIGGALTLFLVVHFSPSRLSDYRSGQPVSHLLRAVFGSSGGAAIIYATAHMPVVDATAIGLLQVVFMIALGIVFLGERVGRVRGIGIGLCCAGAAVMLMSRGAFRQFDLHYLWPALIALIGAALIGMETLLIKMLTRVDRPMTVLLYVNCFGVLLMAAPAFVEWRSIDPLQGLAFLFLGPLAITAQYFVIRGYRIADISVVGPIDYTWLIFAALIGMVFFGEIPTLGVVAGSAIIVGGGLVLAMQRPSRTSTG